MWEWISISAIIYLVVWITGEKHFHSVPFETINIESESVLNEFRIESVSHKIWFGKMEKRVQDWNEWHPWITVKLKDSTLEGIFLSTFPSEYFSSYFYLNYSGKRLEEEEKNEVWLRRDEKIVNVFFSISKFQAPFITVKRFLWNRKKGIEKVSSFRFVCKPKWRRREEDWTQIRMANLSIQLNHLHLSSSSKFFFLLI